MDSSSSHTVGASDPPPRQPTPPSQLGGSFQLGEIEDLDFIFNDLVQVGRFDWPLSTAIADPIQETTSQQTVPGASLSTRVADRPHVGISRDEPTTGAGKVKKKTEELRRKVDAARKTVEGCPIGNDGNSLASSSFTLLQQQLQQQQQQQVHQLLHAKPNPGPAVVRGKTAEDPVRKSKRRKVCQACIACRKAHMSCDLVRPCGRCTKRGMGHLCVDAPKKVDPPKPPPSSVALAPIRPAPPPAVAGSASQIHYKPLQPSLAPLAASTAYVAPVPPPVSTPVAPDVPLTVANLTLEQQMTFLNLLQAGGGSMLPLSTPAMYSDAAFQAILNGSMTNQESGFNTTPSGLDFAPNTMSAVQPMHFPPFDPFSSHTSLIGGLMNSLDFQVETIPNSSEPHENSGAALFNSNLEGLPTGLRVFPPHSSTVPSPHPHSVPRSEASLAEGTRPQQIIHDHQRLQSPLHPSHSPHHPHQPASPQATLNPLGQAAEERLSSPSLLQARSPLTSLRSSTPGTPRSLRPSISSEQRLEPPTPAATFQTSAINRLQIPQTSLFASSSIGSEFAALAELWATVSTSDAPNNHETDGPSTPTVPHACSGPGGHGVKRCNTCPFTPLERFYLTAAGDQPAALGTATERLRDILHTKRRAGLLESHDYTAGYVRLGHHLTTQCSSTTRQRVLTVVSSFQTGFAALARNITDAELLASEETLERLLMEYDTLFGMMGIPSAVWRRTGEIVRANQAFADFVGLDPRLFTGGLVCIYDLLNEDSAVGYWERFGRVAFDSEEKGWMGTCTVRLRDKQDPPEEKKCAYSVTVRRDTVGVPLLCAGNFLPATSVPSRNADPLVLPSWVQESLDVADRLKKTRLVPSVGPSLAETAAKVHGQSPATPALATTSPSQSAALSSAVMSRDVANLVNSIDGTLPERDALRRALEDLVGVN
ncbi:hypothetical protein HKX48_003139 [Thoreauomyces humboldtii]|nr:hypothetical protein HKX48_003139 [Thoreauomyces humboldtii]